MGKNMKRLLLYAIQSPGWQTYSRDRATGDGFIVVNEHRQFRLRLPDAFRQQSQDITDMSESRQTQFTRCKKCGRLHDSGWECVHCKAAEPEPEPEGVRPRFAPEGQREFGGEG